VHEKQALKKERRDQSSNFDSEFRVRESITYEAVKRAHVHQILDLFGRCQIPGQSSNDPTIFPFLNFFKFYFILGFHFPGNVHEF